MISFDLDATLAVVTEGARAELGERPLRVTLERDPAVPARLCGDEHRLRRCLRLLLGHALAVSDQGGIALTVKALASDSARPRVRFEVRDARGPLPATFERDETEAPPTDAEGVDPLALWFGMTRLLTHELGMTSSQQRGNVCWFTVTFERDDMTSSDEQRVLVVDDNLINQKVASHMLQRLGYVVDVAGDGRQALAATDSHHYRLILMDCHMPVMDGYAATEEIRRREGSERRTPIVALTAHAQDDNRRHCLEIGMDGFVTKPVNGKALEDVLRTWLS